MLDTDPVATKQNGTTFTAQRIPTRGRKTARTPATQKGVKARRVISRRPMSGKIKSTLKSKKQQMGDETTLSSIGSLLDRCPGGVKSMAINSPVPVSTLDLDPEKLTSVDSEFTKHPSRKLNTAPVIQHTNHTYHNPPFNKRLSTSTPTKIVHHRPQVKPVKHMQHIESQPSDATVENLSKLLAARIDSARKAAKLSQEILLSSNGAPTSTHTASYPFDRGQIPDAAAPQTSTHLRHYDSSSHLDHIATSHDPAYKSEHHLSHHSGITNSNATTRQTYMSNAAELDRVLSPGLSRIESPVESSTHDPALMSPNGGTSQHDSLNSQSKRVTFTGEDSVYPDVPAVEDDGCVPTCHAGASHVVDRPSSDASHTSHLESRNRTQDLSQTLSTFDHSSSSSIQQQVQDEPVETQHNPAPHKGASHATVVHDAHNINYLIQQLRSTLTAQSNIDAVRIVELIDQSVGQIVTDAGLVDWHTEVDLAMQPLRTENAQLRRKIRILAQQAKEKEDSNSVGSENIFDVVHLKLLLQNAESQLSELHNTNEQLQATVEFLTDERNKINTDKMQLLEVLENKDKNHVNSEKTWSEEVCRLQSDLQTSNNKLSDMYSSAQKDHQYNDITCQQKDKEIRRLQGLVNNLQDKMNRLLNEMKSNETPERQADLIPEVNVFPTMHADKSPQRPVSAKVIDGLLTEAALKAHDSYFKPIGIPNVPTKQMNMANNTQYQPTKDEERQPQRALKHTVNHMPLRMRNPDGNIPEKSGNEQSSDEQDKSSGVIIVDSFDTEADTTGTQYYNPAPKTDAGYSKLTVRDILAPYADSLSPKKSDQVLNVGSEKRVEFKGTVLYEPSESSHSARKLHFPDRIEETGSMISRFSVNDYFKKYDRGTQINTSSFVNPSIQQRDIVEENNETSPSTGGSSVTLSNSSQQQIPNDDSRSVVSGTTCLTVTTSDENAFKDGLANLDANIARIQQSLKNVAL